MPGSLYIFLFSTWAMYKRQGFIKHTSGGKYTLTPEETIFTLISEYNYNQVDMS